MALNKGIILNFSPNRNGSSSFVTDYIYKNLKKHTEIEKININNYKINPCGNCVRYCFKYAKCKIKDDMWKIYKHLETDNFIIVVTPVYFYHIPGYAKIMIDRCQPYWVKKYILKESNFKERLGFIVCIGATKGEKLFSGIDLTMRYFFDIFNLKFNKNFNFYIRNVENKKDIDIKNLNFYLRQIEKRLKIYKNATDEKYKT